MKKNKLYTIITLFIVTTFSLSNISFSANAIPENNDKQPVSSKPAKKIPGSQSLKLESSKYSLEFTRDSYAATSVEEISALRAEQAKVAAEEAAKKAAEEKQKAAEEAKKAKTNPTKPNTNMNIPNVTPNPGSAQEYAKQAVLNRGWSETEFGCLVLLWNKESGWRVNANNASSGAYGIPQALPGTKMATAGADWQTNPNTQIEWGLGYITSRYGTPCGAWAHSQAVNWY